MSSDDSNQSDHSSLLTPGERPRVEVTSTGTVVKKDASTGTAVKKIKKDEEEVKIKKVPMLSTLAAIFASMSYLQAQPLNKKKK